VHIQNLLNLLNSNNDKQKIDKIMTLSPELRKYFTFYHIVGLESPETVKRPWLSIIRHITKITHKMTYKDKQITINGKIIRSKIYTFIKK
jgi:hypothetical protein